MNFYISDLHLGHKNILRFDPRPWYDVDEMNKALIEKWNSVVNRGDTVYHLGDFLWKGDADTWKSTLNKLNGHKVFIKGNHDPKNIPTKNPNLSPLIPDMKDYMEIKDGRYKIILSHYPLLAYKHSYDPDTFMFYGHVHSNTKEAEMINQFTRELINNHQKEYDNRGQLINVGCMKSYMDYTPRTAEYLIEKFYEGKTLLAY